MRVVQKGFTLIEIMLVLVLLSLSAVAVIVNLPESNEDIASEQAYRLYQRLQLLNEDAVLNGQDYGLWADDVKGRYRFMYLNLDGWQLVDDNPTYSEMELEPELALSLRMGDEGWAQDDRLFKPGGLFDEDMFADEEKKKKNLPPPQVMVLSSGEITPFVLSFYPNVGNEDQDGWRIKVSEAGLITLHAPGESLDAQEPTNGF